jgi:putative peptide zinc metalloprotease protein
MVITLNSRLVLVPTEIRKDKKHFIVEDPASGEFYEMPDICIDAINMINKGLSLLEIESLLLERYPRDDVELINFAQQLLELNLIAEIDGVPVEMIAQETDNLGFEGISPKLGKFFFNKIAYFVYLFLFLLNISLFIARPSLIPHYKDLFIFDLMAVNIPVWLLLTVFLVVFHEFGHVLAMRAQNLPTKLEVGHRLFLIVLETDMSLAWKLPSKARNGLYLSGLCFDTLILSFALISQILFPNGSAVFLSIINFVVFNTFIRMVYQFCIYMKTDIYYVIENVTGCYNLMENAQQLLKKKLLFLKSNIEEDIYTSERSTVQVYSIFYLAGVVLTLSLYFIFYIPQLLFAWNEVLPGFKEGPTSLPFWDAMIFSLLVVAGLMILLNSWHKKYLKK